MVKKRVEQVYGKLKNGDERLCFLVKGYLYENLVATFKVYPIIVFGESCNVSPKTINLLVYIESKLCRTVELFDSVFDRICEVYSKTDIDEDGCCSISSTFGGEIYMHNYITNIPDGFHLYIDDEWDHIAEYIGIVNKDNIMMAYRIAETDNEKDNIIFNKVNTDKKYDLIDIAQ